MAQRRYGVRRGWKHRLKRMFEFDPNDSAMYVAVAVICLVAAGLLAYVLIR